MKKSLIYILLLASNLVFKLHGCGYYPNGEYIRFCFTHSSDLNMPEFSEFDYSVHNFYSSDRVEYSANVELWFQYCNKNIPKSVIEEAIYKIPSYELENRASTNSMVQYLYRQNDIETIAYLKFAKNCESFNQKYEDPWERNEQSGIEIRKKIIQKAAKKIEETHIENLRRRYAFLAIRLSYYNKNEKEIAHLFDKYIKNTDLDIIYYWSLYFRTKVEKNNALRSYYAAQVFANSAEKRFTIFRNFDFKLPESSILKYAKNNTEKATIYALKGIKTHGKGLNYLQKMAQLDPENKLLPFLILREVNKLEDWILTPYFSLFDPALSEHSKEWYYYSEKDDFSYVAIQGRIKKDRVYAKKVLSFVQTLPKSIQEKTVFNILEIQLQYLTQNYNEALQKIAFLKNKTPIKKEIYNQLERTEALCTVALQEEAQLTNEIKKVILKNKENKKFVFAIARELEYKGNTVEALLLYAALEKQYKDYRYSEVSWKSKRNKKNSYVDYFDSYFEYINVMYSVDEVKHIIADILANKNNTDDFSVWKYNLIQKDIPKLYDLAGTMYIRKNKLESALSYFNKIDDTYWDTTKYLWGKIDENGNRDYQNPFYKLNYTYRFIEEKETFELNKKTVTAKLIEYLEKAESVDNKDYYYFLVANCYYNMTIYGNSWMMRRFGVSAYDTDPYPEDEDEFRKGTLAKKYYTLAYENATNDKFRVLCLKMIGKCEYFEKVDNSNRSKTYLSDQESNLLFEANSTYIRLKNMNQEYYENLTSGNCAWFQNYFKPSSED